MAGIVRGRRTTSVRTFTPHPPSWLVPTLAVSQGGAACLTAQDAGAHEVWRTDGTPAGTDALTQFGTPFPMRNLTGNGTHLYFAGSRQAHRRAARRMAGETSTGARTSRGGPGRG
jgi:hypothetical protein